MTDARTAGGTMGGTTTGAVNAPKSEGTDGGGGEQRARHRVLLVDDETRTLDLLGQVLTRENFEVRPASSPSEAITALGHERFDAVVTDVVFHGVADGNQVLEAARRETPEPVVVLITGYPALEGAVSAIKDGAFDYLQKPVEPMLLAATIHRAIRERRMRTTDMGFHELVDILSDMVANTIERIDPYTAGHGERTRRYARLLAERLGVDRPTTEKLELAAIAHDYGKIYLDDLGFLTKPGPLTAEEYREVQKHPALGAEKLGDHERLREVCTWVAEHHEKWDGTGYPHRKRADEISVPGRILGVVEVFDSLATRRSYKEAWQLERVTEYFRDQRGRAFDPEVLDPWVEMLEEHGVDWLQQPERDRQARAQRCEESGLAAAPQGPGVP
jgi:putative two-component system response regulator